ncbi:MAG: 3-phosphoshikimate 1-carboxyvinyltransferase [Planctomycetota bacterium]|nr:3-phosphoshikimate 1-carboxyvinyltransferase [Planctomycetota bacterium]
MSQITVHRAKELRGTLHVPGDKSISHRALMFAGLAKGTTSIKGFLNGKDCHATLQIMGQLGVTIHEVSPTELTIEGSGRNGLKEAEGPLDCDNSGTTMRLLAGLLSPQHFYSVLTGTPQLRSRPMGRIANPLREMGAIILGRKGGLLAPLTLAGTSQSPQLRGIRYEMPVASAQVKSAILLAGLNAVSRTTVIEPGPARDHTERMLQSMGAPLTIDNHKISVDPLTESLTPLNMTIPGDISSAAFLIVAACLVEGSDVELKGVGLNSTRMGIVTALLKMGANIEIANERVEGGEPVGDLRIRASELTGAEFGGRDIVTMIDEIPVLVLAASQAKGQTVIRDAGELRVKESDRIAVTAELLRSMGADVEERPDGFTVAGSSTIKGGVYDSHGDHRLAMMLAIAGLVAVGETTVTSAEVIPDSYPGFEDALRELGATVSAGG